MGKKQTRKTVSLNGRIHLQFTAKAAELKQSMSRIIEDLLCREFGFEKPTGRRLDPDGLVKHKEEIIRIGAERSQKSRLERLRQIAADVEHRRLDRLRQAQENPCRKERCKIEGIHAAHD